MEDIMTSYFLNMLIGGAIYLALVFFVIKLLKLKTKTFNPRRNNNNNDDDDGGLEFYTEPDLDLPPGVSLPDGDSRQSIYRKEHQDVLI
jgi:hypothetical protein